MVATRVPHLGVEQSPSGITADEYLATCELDYTELINGQVVELTRPNEQHGFLVVNLASLLNVYVRQHRLGRVLTETGYILARNPDTVRGPDVSFVDNARVQGQPVSAAFREGAPTLAVEVTLPGDRAGTIEAKVLLYLQAGTEQVWLIDPKSESITVRTATQPPATYLRGDLLSGGTMLPGFVLAVEDIFNTD